jgi:hypothetical protein
MNYLVGALLVLSALLAGWALVLAVDNPDIDGTSRGDDYTCLAPWDTVLNDADNSAGGEPPPDDDQIDARCRAAGEDRFDRAVQVGVAAAVVMVLTGVAAVARHRYDNGVST